MIEVREARLEDEAGILELFSRAFSRSIPVEHFRWKRARSFVAVDGARVVAHYGLSPRRYRVRGRDVDAVLGVDAATDPDYRRRGLLTQLGARVRDDARTRGVAFELGIPSAMYGSRYEALGWEPLFPLRVLIRPLLLPPLPFASKAAYLREADATLDQLWVAHADDFEVSLVRDRFWVVQRYLESPVLKYRVLSVDDAWVVVRNDGDIGYVVDELGSDAALRVAISAAVEDLRAKGARKAQVLIAPGTRRARLYQRLGFLYPRDRLVVSWRPYDPASVLPRAASAFLVRAGDFDFG